MGKFISGLPTQNNLDRWHNYAKQNSYGDSKPQRRDQLLRSGAESAKTIGPMTQVPQRNSEGRGWADMKATTADNTYTGKCGTKRD
jgi:hypothetical protein